MVEKGKPWWRDPKFVVPSILIPVLAIVIPLWFTDKVSETLSIDLEIEDPRRPNPFLDLHIEKGFSAKNQSHKDIAAELANTLAARLDAFVSANPETRALLAISVNQKPDGTLFIEESFSRKASLHLTRFPETKTIWEILQAEFPHRFVQMTLEERNLFTPQHQKEVPAGKPIMESGLYRVVVTTPGYRDGFKFLELTRDGEIFGSDDFGDITPVTFPFAISLGSRFGESGRLTIAIQPFLACTKLGTHKPLVEGILRTIQSALEQELQKKDFLVFVVKPEMKLDFHPYRIKKMGPPDNHKFADFLIKGRCQWG